MIIRRISNSILILWITLAILVAPVSAQNDQPLVLVLEADGAVTQVMAEFISRGIEIAEEREAEALVIQLNTPGGNVTTMQEIVSNMRNSPVPIVVYVTPAGAMAGSAGTVITLAGHIAAMAPETVIGAASPVGGQGEDIGETSERKLKEVLKAQVRALAEHRGSEAVSLAEETIETAVAVSSNEALEVGLIDYVSDNLEELLGQIDGRVVETASGSHTLATANAVVEYVELTFIETVLAVLTNPNIIFIMITIGVQAILIEISNPGGWFAGFLGVILLGLAFYGLGVLPVNWFGLLILATSFVLFILDIKAPTHGALTIAGVGTLIAGALVLFNSPGTPQFQRVSVPLVVGMSLFTGLTFAVIVGVALRSQKAPVRTGLEGVVGKSGKVETAIPRYGAGRVQLASEEWTAELAPGEEPIDEGAEVEVVASKGVRVIVRKIKD